MVETATWHGTQQESMELVNAVARYCACEYGMYGIRTVLCGGHEMLLKDQRALNGLLFVRRITERLKREEWGETFQPQIPL